MKFDSVLNEIIMDLTILGPYLSSNLFSKIAPSIYWLFDHPIDGSTAIYWMASNRWQLATTELLLVVSIPIHPFILANLSSLLFPAPCFI